MWLPNNVIQSFAISLAKYICLAKWVWLKHCCNNTAAGLAVSLASDRQTNKAQSPKPGPQVLISIQVFSCDVICMSPLNRSCGVFSLSSICRSFFLPPKQQRLWAGRSCWTPFLRSQRDWSDFLSCFLGLYYGYNKSVFMWVSVLLYFHLCERVYVCVNMITVMRLF